MATAQRATDRRRAQVAGLLGIVIVAAGCGLVAAAVRPAWQLRYTDPIQPDPQVTAVSTWQPSEFPTAGPIQAPGSGQFLDLPAFLRTPWPWIVLAGLVAALIAVVLVRRWQNNRIEPLDVETLPSEVDVQPEVPVLQRGAEEASRRLLTGGDPTDAIITAWLALEEAASSSGIVRGPAQTPTEFTTDVLSRTGLVDAPVEELLRLYLRARFSAGGAGPEDLVTAQRCVQDLADAWRDYRLHSSTRS